MENQVYINVADVIGSPSALTQEQGNIVYNILDAAISNKQIAILDFEQIESIISPFLNNAIGQLYGKYTSEQIKDFLQLQNFPDEKNSTLNIVIANAKRFYTNKESFNSVVEDTINS